MLSPAQQAAAAQVTVAQQALNNAQTAYAAANPTDVMNTRVANDKAALQTKYIEPTQAALAKALQDCTTAGLYLRNLTDMVGPSIAYTSNLAQQASDLQTQKTQLTQQTRTQRRAFMDQFPQSGTGGYFMHHTADDFALLIFLIGFLAAFISIYTNLVPSFSYKLYAGFPIFMLAWYAVTQAVIRFG